ncbi:hypothetical protein BN1088_150003 [Sphingobacterium sp. PM2-P1-29]|nr:hypothetical protein BN1088_150003 [Sphingobacterium sp. PM2-P1-29]
MPQIIRTAGAIVREPSIQREAVQRARLAARKKEILDTN